MNWPKTKKIIVLKCCLLLFCAKMTSHFSIRLWHVMKSGFYMTTSSVVGLRRSSKALLKSKLAPEKCHGHYLWSAASLIHYSFLNPSKTITSEKYAQQTDEMHRKLQHLQLALGNRMDQILLHDNAQLRVTQPSLQNWSNWAPKFCFIFHIYLTSRQSTTNSSNISTAFCRENASTTSRIQKMLSKSSSNPKEWIFILQP